MEQMRIVKEMRNESRRQLKESGATFSVRDIKPRYMVWENVTGAYSSGNPAGSDFAAVLEEITRVVVNEPPTVSVPEQGWPYSGCIEGVGDEGVPFSICWRTHDAQYWGKTIIDNSGRVVKPGTPQRRRRIALVADFGGQSAPEILFECESSTGNSKQSTEERQAVTETSTGCSGKSGKGESVGRSGDGIGDGWRVTGVYAEEPKAIENHPNDSRVKLSDDGIVQTLSGRMGTGGGNTPMVMESRHTIAIEGNGSRESHKGDGYAESDVMYTLNTVEQHAVCVSEPAAVESHPQDSRVKINPNDVNQTLSSNMEHDPANGGLVLQKTAEPIAFDGHQTTCPVTEDGVAPTMITTGVGNVMTTPEPILLESNQNHATVQTDGVSTTLPASMGEGGGYVPMVVDDQKIGIKQEGCDLYNLRMTGDISATLSTVSGTPDGSGGKVLMSNVPVYAAELGASSRIGGHVTEEVAPTLRAHMGDNQTAVVYGMSSYDSNAMKSDNPESGIYEADTARTLDLNGGNPACNQGGMMVVQPASDKSLKESVETYATSGIPSEGCLNPWDVQSKHIQPEDGVAESLYAGECRYGGGESYVLQNQESGCLNGWDVQSKRVFDTESVCGTLNSGTTEGINIVPSVLQQPPVQSMELFHCTSEEDKVQTLKARDYKDPQVVCVDMGGGKSQCGVTQDQSPTLTTTHGGEPVVHQATPIPTTSIVRRLTPLECERLQGFPDGWTDIGEWVDEKGKKHKSSDAPRYKALGNSIALPFWDWMADRMCRKLRESGRSDLTMGSLFDGISGFPLVYSRHGCKPSWTSEIEQFPIAVCKQHFGDETTGEVGDLGQWLKPMSGTQYHGDNQYNAIYGLDRASFNSGRNAKYDFSVEDDKAQTLLSRGPGG